MYYTNDDKNRLSSRSNNDVPAGALYAHWSDWHSGYPSLFSSASLPFSPLALLASSLFLVIMCWAMNTIFAFVLNVPTNIESASITALILALIIDPAQSPIDFQFLGWAAILAMASKYIVALYKKHLFNPAAIAVVITSCVLGKSASWWVGTVSMLPIVLIGGWLVARKLRQEDMLWSFCAAVLVGVGTMTFVQRLH